MKKVKVTEQDKELSKEELKKMARIFYALSEEEQEELLEGRRQYRKENGLDT